MSTSRAAAVALLAAFLAAVAVSVGRATAADYWDALADCETHGRWSQRGAFYVGGLGIYYRNWQRWAPRVGVHKPAYLASREEQIRVAKYGYRVDRAYWGCMRIVGMPW